MQLHGLRLLYDFEQVTDLLYLAARLRVVRLNGYVIDLLKPQRMSRCDVLLQATSQALFRVIFMLAIVSYPFLTVLLRLCRVQQLPELRRAGSSGLPSLR